MCRGSVQVAGSAVGAQAQNTVETPVSSTQTFLYKMSLAPSTPGGFVSAVGFLVPNGDS